MAVTAGHGNPKWTRDETLLALDLYLQCTGSVPGPKDPRVIKLSEIIQALPIHVGGDRKASFRNPDGVAFKMQNLRQIATGQGLGNVSATDREVWADYGDRPEEVHRLAELIKAEKGQELPLFAVDEVFKEGRILTAVHLRRERKPLLRRKLLKNRRELGALKCDVCGDGPKVNSEKFDDATFEVHHRRPLAHGDGEKETRLQDVALLCASCHRLIHRMMSVERRWIDVTDLQRALE